MRLSEQILELKQATNTVTSNPLLDAINLRFIEQMEVLGATDRGASRILAQMSKIVEGLKIQDIESHKRLYGRYGEAKFYVSFKDKQDVQIEHLSDHGRGGQAGPDFCIRYGGREFFGEVKSPVMLGGNLKYGKLMEDSLAAKINVETQAKQTGIGIGLQVIAPHQKNNRAYDERRVTLVIENLIDKFSQNYKPEQYAMGDTLSLIYLNPQNFPLFSFGTLANKILAVYFDKTRNAPVSGDLWSAAFGRKGMLVFCPPLDKGKPSIEDTLAKDGILRAYPDVKAICFYVESFGQDRREVVGLFPSRAGSAIRNLIARLTSMYNDDGNTETWRLLSL